MLIVSWLNFIMKLLHSVSFIQRLGRIGIPTALYVFVALFGIVGSHSIHKSPAATINQSTDTVASSADPNGDGYVNILDLSILLSHWHQTGSGITDDINGDGTVDVLDLSILLNDFGTTTNIKPANIEYDGNNPSPYGLYEQSNLTNPNISGVDVVMDWTDVEPQQGVLNSAPADNEIAAWAKAGKKFTVIIRYIREHKTNPDCSAKQFLPHGKLREFQRFAVPVGQLYLIILIQHLNLILMRILLQLQTTSHKACIRTTWNTYGQDLGKQEKGIRALGAVPPIGRH
jgi:hypothetical protein